MCLYAQKIQRSMACTVHESEEKGKRMTGAHWRQRHEVASAANQEGLCEWSEDLRLALALLDGNGLGGAAPEGVAASQRRNDPLDLRGDLEPPAL